MIICDVCKSDKDLHDCRLKFTRRKFVGLDIKIHICTKCFEGFVNNLGAFVNKIRQIPVVDTCRECGMPVTEHYIDCSKRNI